MKKLLLLIICIIALAQACFSPVFYASATGTAGGSSSASSSSAAYARAMVNDGYFFTQKDLSTSIFAVPYTYCVQLIRDDGEWYYVKYAEDTGVYRALYGYVRREDFKLLSEKPEVTYLYKPVTVTYRADDGSSSLPVLGEISVEAAFYGNFYSGATAYSYVLCQGTFGYIQGANDDYPLNIEEEPPPEDEQKKEHGVNSGVVTAIVLVALAAGALILLFVTTRKRDGMNG